MIHGPSSIQQSEMNLLLFPVWLRISPPIFTVIRCPVY